MSPPVAVDRGGRDLTAGAASSVRDGVSVMVPFVAGFAPFALAIGAVAARGNAWAGWSGSWLIYGGSAHLGTLQGLGRSGLVVAILTGVLVNARLLVYSASLGGRWAGQPTWFRLAAAPLVIDPTWAVTEARPLREVASDERRFFFAAGLTLGIGWSAMMAAGVALGGRLDATSLAVAVPLCLVGLVAPRLVDADTRWVCLAAAATTLLTGGFPAGTGLLVAAGAGVLVGAALAARRA
jgi:branched chain amino acid efflux pump